MTISPTLLEQLDYVPGRLAGHIWLSLGALFFGIVVSLPLGVVATRYQRVEAFTLAVASVCQTIPSLALLALMVWAWGTIGWIPALLALVLYTILPILRNTVTGLQGVDPAYIEAAQGIGMTKSQMFWRVEFPLAFPTILAGVRTATVWVVGLATIAQPIGAVSLGNYIFAGLQTSNPTALLVGCILSAVLALALDGIIRLFQLAVDGRSFMKHALAAFFLVAVVFSPQFIEIFRFSGSTGQLASTKPSAANEEDEGPVVIGGKTFTESYIMANLLKHSLKEEGLRGTIKGGMGSSIIFEALVGGDIDVYVDYSGTIWSTIMKKESSDTPVRTLTGAIHNLQEVYGISVLGVLGFRNSYALALPASRVKDLGIKTISELVPHAKSMSIVSDVEFFDRPEWQALQADYGIGFKTRTTMDSTLMYGAVYQGVSDLLVAYSTDGRIPAYELALLEDDLGSLPPYDAIILLSERASHNRRLGKALRPLVNQVSTPMMQEANRMVDLDGQSPEQAATFLYESIFGSKRDRLSAK